MTMLAAAAIIAVAAAVLSPQHAGTAGAVAYATALAALALVFGRATLFRYRKNFTQLTNHTLIWVGIAVVVVFIGWVIK